MPKLVKEVTSGSSNERSSEGGKTADTSVRTFRIILSSPDEAYNVQQAIGVYVGSRHPVNTNLPCVSISERAEGESRVVRIVTATYKTNAGNGQQDPQLTEPELRPAKFAISASLAESPAEQWRRVSRISLTQDLLAFEGAWEEPTNPVGDMYDGVSTLTPIITISVEQFDSSPTDNLAKVGYINADLIYFGSLKIYPASCMLRSINVRPVVESFGDVTYRGFTRSYEFAIKPYVIEDGLVKCGGWIIKQILEGFNIKNSGLGVAGVFQDGLVLEHLNGHVDTDNLRLAVGLEDKKARAVVPIHFPGGKWCQRPSAQPVALNADGTPRDVENDGVTQYGYITQTFARFGNNFRNLGVRVEEIL